MVEHQWKKTSYGDHCLGCGWVGKYPPHSCSGGRYLAMLEEFGAAVDQGIDNCQRLFDRFPCLGSEAEDHDDKCLHCLAGGLIDRIGQVNPEGE